MIVKMLLFPLLFAVQLTSDPVTKGSISIHFSGIETKKGDAYVHLFNSDKGFPDSEKLAFKTYRINVEGRDNTFQILDIPYGEYAISCYHDINKNKVLDTNFFGIPKERIGTSNNPNSVGLPEYQESKFVLNKKNLELSVKLQ